MKEIWTPWPFQVGLQLLVVDMKSQKHSTSAKDASSQEKATAGPSSGKSSSNVHTKLSEDDSRIIADVLSKSREATPGLVEIARRHKKLAG